MPVIDVHSHILPGIDDGSRNTETSLAMLTESERQGVSHIIATPHFYADRMRVNDFLENRERAFNKVKEALDQENLTSEVPQIFLGAEVAFFSGISHADMVEELRIHKADLSKGPMLLEMPFVPWDDDVLDEVETLVYERKIPIVLAHLERFMGIRGNKPYIKEIQSMDLLVQINAESLTDWKIRGELLKEFKEGRAHLIGSDCHGIHHRPPCLADGRAAIEKKLGPQALERIDQCSASLLGLS